MIAACFVLSLYTNVGASLDNLMLNVIPAYVQGYDNLHPNISFVPVQMEVHDSDPVDISTCYSFNDPHIVTFDGQSVQLIG